MTTSDEKTKAPAGRMIGGRSGKPYNKDCPKAVYAKEYRNRNLAKIAKIKESGCIQCGYNAHPETLQFHHMDPSTKKFGIGSSVMRSWEKLQAEINKCVLLCANCHCEVENGHRTL